MLKCKEIVEIIASDKKLTLKGKMELKFHLLMCKHCNTYFEQLKIMSAQFKKVFDTKAKVDADHLNELEHKIVELVKNKQEKKS